MRIIAGKYKGRKIAVPKGMTVRPTLDRVRESLFSILADRVVDAEVLDLFAGSGAYGLEALSRGARSCLFVENSYAVSKILKNNVQLIVSDAFASESVICKDAFSMLKTFSLQELSFSLIFADPPYQAQIRLGSELQNSAIILLQKIGSSAILKKQGIVVLEHSKNVNLPEKEKELFLSKRKNYGDTSLSIYTRC